jgi:hypothetical protein
MNHTKTKKKVMSMSKFVDRNKIKQFHGADGKSKLHKPLKLKSKLLSLTKIYTVVTACIMAVTVTAGVVMARPDGESTNMVFRVTIASDEIVEPPDTGEDGGADGGTGTGDSAGNGVQAPGTPNTAGIPYTGGFDGAFVVGNYGIAYNDMGRMVLCIIVSSIITASIIFAVQNRKHKNVMEWATGNGCISRSKY